MTNNERCESCEIEQSADEMRWFGDTPYCSDCFYERYIYCNRCDEAIDRDYARYDDDDDPLCNYCYDEECDPDAPNNPTIHDCQRKEIISLSKDWLNGKRPKRLIKINKNDYLLLKIQEGVGLVDYTLYLYGLRDREEYQIRASKNLLPQIQQHINKNHWKVKIEEDVGTNRIGISKTLRENNLPQIITLLSTLTTNKTPEIKVA